uniref:Rab-GAP TBC domain-containing protein n=1 Tax=Parastrongyloides trichosuri TaxID=131310 RepID=A0A0N5A272_PARTI
MNPTSNAEYIKNYINPPICFPIIEEETHSQVNEYMQDDIISSNMSDTTNNINDTDSTVLTQIETSKSYEKVFSMFPLTDKHGFIRDNNVFSNEEKAKKKLSFDVMLRRERKWLKMIDHWNDYMASKFDIIKRRCRKGIPDSLRGRAWKHLCGAYFHMHIGKNKNVFDLVSQQNANPKYVDDIKKDLDRQFPDHELFSRLTPYGSKSKEDLFILLRSYTVLHPDDGYSQAQAPIAAVLLMYMPLKDAFYCFVQICHKYLPGYFTPDMEQIKIDGEVLKHILLSKCPRANFHLKKNLVDPTMYLLTWFMCIFCRTLPWESVLRIWDMFFCEGIKVLFKVALVIISETFGNKKSIIEYPDQESILMKLKELPKELLSEEVLIKKVLEVNLDEYDLERAHYKIMRTRKLRCDTYTNKQLNNST